MKLHSLYLMIVIFLCMYIIGKCLAGFTNGKTPYCIKFNPDEDKQHLFVVGCADKKIYTVNLLFPVLPYSSLIWRCKNVTIVIEKRYWRLLFWRFSVF